MVEGKGIFIYTYGEESFSLRERSQTRGKKLIKLKDFKSFHLSFSFLDNIRKLLVRVVLKGQNYWNVDLTDSIASRHTRRSKATNFYLKFFEITQSIDNNFHSKVRQENEVDSFASSSSMTN